MLCITFLSKRRGDRSAFINNLAVSLVYLTALTVNVFITSSFDSIYKDFILFPFDIFTLAFIIGFLPFFMFLVHSEKKKVLAHQRENSQDTISDQFPLKYDIYRKLSHLVVLGIILFYFTLGALVQLFFIDLLKYYPEQVSEYFYSIFSFQINMLFTQYLVVFLVGISVIGLLTADIVRILKPEIYPLKPVNRILRQKELHMRFGPQISMAIGCFSIIIVFGLFQPLGPLIICTAMTMGIFSDIASNIIGRTLGKREIRSTKKTYEGLFAGIGIAFLAGLIMMSSLRWFFTTNLISLILLPLIGSLIIGFLDYLDLEIDDNLTFNVCTTVLLFFLAIFIM
ncbi:MAG: phosphatidate cytidylyltransferase [Promethearchaeota archaeon]